jgi:DNA-binding transcriptional LysR family regulator
MFLKDLDYFCAVARVENIAKAAESLGVAQPTISKAISRLERQLGVRLFERLARGVRLSPAGTAFLRHANGASNLLRDAAVQLRAFRWNEAGVIRIGAGVGVSESLLENAISEVIEKYPAVRFQVRGGTSDMLLDAVGAGIVDIAIAGVPWEARTGLRWHTLYKAPLVFAAPKGHPLTKVREVTMEQLSASRLLLPVPGNATRAMLDALFVSEGCQPPLPFIESHTSAREIVLALRFNCVVMLAEASFEIEEVAKQMKRLKVPPHWDLVRPISAVTRISRNSDHVSCMLRALTNQCAERALG